MALTQSLVHRREAKGTCPPADKMGMPVEALEAIMKTRRLTD